MQFEWDSRKAAANLRKHGVAFADAVTVFADPLARTFTDPDHSEREYRELIVGYDQTHRLLIASFAERGDNVRIISARRATAREIHVHEEHVKRPRQR
ncbi:MAG: BrnT family toxin [Rhodanobacteraceae bacterium]